MTCNCTSNTPLTAIYSCSGAADVGELADRAARALARSGAGRMSCAVGVGAGVQSLRNTALSAGRVLAIDGCAVGCVSSALKQAGVAEFVHVELGRAGFPKGTSPADETNLAAVLALVQERLATA